MISKNTFAFQIFLLLKVVYWPVHFNYQSGCMTIEVHDKARNDLLTAKMDALETVSTQLLPEESLRHCHCPT